MVARLRNIVLRWVLLCSVALGVVVMHHVIAEGGPPVHAVASASMIAPPMDEPPVPDPDPEHDVVHLCMAVIQHSGTALIVLLLLFLGVVAPLAARRAGHVVVAVRVPARPPPGLSGRALLHSVCIARV